MGARPLALERAAHQLRGNRRRPTGLDHRHHPSDRPTAAWARTTPMARFLFMPESAYGPTNNCIGIGNILRQRGHEVIFAAERSLQLGRPVKLDELRA